MGTGSRIGRKVGTGECGVCTAVELDLQGPSAGEDSGVCTAVGRLLASACACAGVVLRLDACVGVEARGAEVGGLGAASGGVCSGDPVRS